jgi:RNA polymerase sigma-70 factor (ECF subfamily)
MEDDALRDCLATDLDGSFESLVVGHQDRLYSIALRLTGDTRDAEEIAQDAFVRAYRALAEYPVSRIRELRLRPWLATITVNLARNRRRRASDRQPALPLPESGSDGLGPAPAEGQPERVHGRRESTAAWARVVADLPERYRIPVVLRHVDDLSYAEMAEALGRPEGTLKAQVHRGLAMLRAALESVDREELTA